jgi:hypothetical protein
MVRGENTAKMELLTTITKIFGLTESLPKAKAGTRCDQKILGVYEQNSCRLLRLRGLPER